MTSERGWRGLHWWRLWTLEGSFNRERLQGLGWLVALAGAWRARGLPPAALAQRLAHEPTAANTHPYLAGVALGARLRLEEDGEPEEGSRVARGLASALGGIGDRLFWSALVPLLGLATLGLLLADQRALVVVVWLAYAATTAWLRRQLLVEGYRRGAAVVDLLQDRRIHRAATAMQMVSAGLVGVVGGAFLAGASAPSSGREVILAALAVGWGAWAAARRTSTPGWGLGLLLLSLVGAGLKNLLF